MIDQVTDAEPDNPTYPTRSRSPFTKDVIVLLVGFYGISALILVTTIGVWETIRQVLMNGIIVIAWLSSIHFILRDVAIPETLPIRYPRMELGWLLLGLITAIGLAANTFVGWINLPRWLFQIATTGVVLLLFIGLRYPLTSLGIRWSSKRAWLATLAVILINFAAGFVFQFMPMSEKIVVQQADLSNQIAGPMSFLILLAGILLRAAVPEELLFRIGLQPRLAHLMPLGWAIVVQALLFNIAHVPQRLLYYNEAPLLAFGYMLILDNGLLGGYLWYRTRSLPILLVIHILAYPRIGI